MTVFCDRLLHFVGMELKKLIVVEMAALAQEGNETATVYVGVRGRVLISSSLCALEFCLRRLLACNGSICWEITMSLRAEEV